MKSFKRRISVLLTVIISLSFIQLSPANAVVVQLGNLTVDVTDADDILYTRVGQAVSDTVTVQSAGASTNNADARKLLLASATVPTGAGTQSANTSTSTSGTFTFTNAGTLGSPYVLQANTATTKIGVAVTSAGVYTLTPHVLAATDTATNADPSGGAKIVGTVSFTPNYPGTFTYTITPKAADGTTAAGTAKTVTVVAYATGSSAGAACTYAYNTSSCTQVIGGSATVTFTGAIGTDAAGGNNYTISSSGVGAIGSATLSLEQALTGATGYTAGAKYLVGTTTAATFPTTSLDFLTADTTAGTESGGVQGVDLVLTSSVAGTQTITVTKKDANGTPTSTYTINVAWTASSNTGINAAKSTIYVDSNTDACIAPTASKAADAVAAAATAISRTPVATAVDVCVIARDANDNLLTVASATVTGSFGRSDTSIADAENDKSYLLDLAAASTVLSGSETITAVVIDSFGNAAVLTTTLSVYSSLKKLEISALRGSAYAAADQTAPANTYAGAVAAAATSNDIIVGVKATDSTSQVIDLQVSANSTATSAWTVDSDKVAGAPADRTAQTLGSSVADMAPEAGELASTSWGTNAAYITCGTLPEKLTVTAWGKDSDGNWLKSNSLDVYCAGATSTVEVVNDRASVASGGTVAVNVMVKDANGYPVADGTAVTLAASNGSTVAPSSKSTEAGKFATAATLVAGSQATSTIVTAIAGGKTGNATVAITGGSKSSIISSLAQVAAAVAKLQKAITKINKRLNR